MNEMTGSLSRISKLLDTCLLKDPPKGRYGIDRAVFTDPELFDLEMKHIFERSWVFVAHDSQVPRPNDFLTTYVGRKSVLLTRDREGQLHGFLNACAHRGATVCREKAGNRRNFTCPFHGWVYSSKGDLLDVANEAAGGYAPSFSHADFGLTPVAKLESYRGFIFVSLDANVEPLEAYLDGATQFIDLVADQSPERRLEVLRGATRYTYRGNWKLQAENGLDGYHVTSVHANYLMTAARRTSGESSNDTQVIDFSAFDRAAGGSFSFKNSHSLLWGDFPNFEVRPSFESRDALIRDFGEATFKWMNGRIRNLLIFPNVFLMDQTSSQIRIIRPIAVDQTEVTTYCIAPVGESAKSRATRIRQYEDFFNASGMATPDDLTEFESCQVGFSRGSGHFNDMSRGSTRWVSGVSQEGEDLGVKAIQSGTHVADEGLYLAIHENWLRTMQNAVAAEQVQGSEETLSMQGVAR